MKVRYKIALFFTLITIILLAALCAFIYYNTTVQQEKDLTKRLANRANTITKLIKKLPVANNYEILSKFDSATSNLLVSENIKVYNLQSEILYQFSRNIADTVHISQALLAEVKSKGSIISSLKNKTVYARFYAEDKLQIIVIVAAIDGNGQKNLYDLQQSLIISFFIGILLACALGLLFSIKLLQPLEKITTTVNNISANSIEKRLPQTNLKDEWNSLSTTFNNLLARLQESFEMQGRFISNASHELSTPLTSVNNQIEITLKKPRTNEEYQKVLESVQADVLHLTALTKQLLTLAQSARGGTISTQRIRVDELLMELPLTLKKIDTNYQAINFFDELPDDDNLCTVNGNSELLFSALKNIAENGCKYATDGTVHISLSFIADKIVVLFSNAYRTFNPAELETMFQPFQRGANAYNSNGYGLGLSLARRIILLHKGEIKAELIEGNRILISIILPTNI